MTVTESRGNVGARQLSVEEMRWKEISPEDYEATV
jgi:hypothetical protein